MEKLKLVLIVVVLLLGVAVVYGYVDDGAEEKTETSVTAVESPSAAAPPQAPAPSRKGDGEDPGADAGSARPPVSRAPLPAPVDEDESKQLKKEPKGKGSKGTEEPEGNSASPGSAPSRAKFVAGAERICAKLPMWFAKRAQQIQGTGVDQEEILRRAAPATLFEAARKLAKLGSPSGGEVDAAALVAALKKAARRVRKDPASGLGTDDVLTDFAQLAKRNGLHRCSRL